MMQPNSNQNLHQPVAETLHKIAVGVFAQHGVDFTKVRRGGWTNLVWLEPDLVLRLCTRPGSTSLLRESRLAALLPAEVGYPEIVETGIAQGGLRYARLLAAQPVQDYSQRRTWAQ